MPEISREGQCIAISNHDDTERRHELRRIVYSIGEGLLVIALFTAALSAQKAMTATWAPTTLVAPPNTQTEGLNANLPDGLNSYTRLLPM